MNNPNQTNDMSSITLTTGTTLDSGQLSLGLESLDFNTLSSNTYQYTPINIQPLTTIGISNTGTSTGINSGISTLNTNWPNNTYEYGLESQIKNLVKKELKPVLDRLAILDKPNQEVLDTFESLRLAYEHYRTLEALMITEIEKITKK